MQALATLPHLDPTTQKPQRVDLLRELWLQRLPSSVRAALHEADDSPIEDLIKKADNLINAVKASHIPDTVYSASPVDNIPDVNAAKFTPLNTQAAPQQPGPRPRSATSLGTMLLPLQVQDRSSQMHPWMSVAKKLLRRPPSTTTVASENHNLRNINALDSPGLGFFITDKLSGRKFLVDTGAFRSLFPATAEDKSRPFKQPSNIKLIAANGSTIPMYGTRTIPIQAAERSFSWDFIIADVKTPLLGADFLSHHGLLVDVANREIARRSNLPLNTPRLSQPGHENLLRENRHPLRCTLPRVP